MLVVMFAASGDREKSSASVGMSSPWELAARDASDTTLTLRYVRFVARREGLLDRVLRRKTVDLTRLAGVDVEETTNTVTITLRTAPATGRGGKLVQAFPKAGSVTVTLDSPLGDRRLVHAPLHPKAEDQIEALEFVSEVPDGYGP